MAVAPTSAVELDTVSDEERADDRRDAVLATLVASRRRGDALPLRRTFAQPAPGSDLTPRLAEFVRTGRDSAYDQFLCLAIRAVAGRHEVSLDWQVWARLAGLREDITGRRAVRRNWNMLAELDLVAINPPRRSPVIQLKREDGSGAAYTPPASERYVRVPFAYWRQDFHMKLSMPAKAMLFIALSQPDWFRMPSADVPDWYGISSASAQRGLAELKDAQLLEMTGIKKPAPLTKEKFATDFYYRLRPPFGPIHRASKSAPDELKAQTASEAPSSTSPDAGDSSMPGG
ncbi:hypothetical protein ACVU7I_01520 [Patulibacter sp. S7RM1-6]